MDSKRLNIKPRLVKRKAECPFASRHDRKRRAKEFLNYDAKYQKHYRVIKACTFPDAECPPPWEEDWLRITWVALRGIDSLCVVALKYHLLQLEVNLDQFDNNTVMTTFSIWNALVNEFEGIEDRYIDRVCRRPFSVVTLISDNSEVCRMRGHEVSSAEYRAKMTSEFLQMEMKSGSTFTLDKTIQTAISAFQHLFGREVEAHEIRVFSWKDGDILGKELKQRRRNPNLEELLASINEPDNNDPDTLTPKKGAAPGVFIAPDDEECKEKKQLPCDLKFLPAAGVFSKEGGLRPCSRERHGDASRFSGNLTVSEKARLFLKKMKANLSKKGRGSRDERRQRKRKVRKSSSKKEIGDAQDTAEQGAKDDMVPEKDDLDNDAEMQEANMKEVELDP